MIAKMKAGNLFLLLLLCIQVPALAQLCNGSLGDPVVNITFGSGGNPGNKLAAATTFYQYITTDCPGDGQYTVRNATSICFGDTWHTLTEDHTPNDANGYFMLVNASYQPGDFYVDTVHSLCGGTTYEFAAWIMNILRSSACSNAGINPNITFRIETTAGVVLASYNTGNIAQDNAPAWKQYGVFFQTPQGVTDAVIRITNNAPGGCGNDLALDDITFRPCGPQITTTLALNGSTTLDVCEGDTRSFVFNGTYSSGYNNPVLQWQVSVNGGTNWLDIPGANSTSYMITPVGGPATTLYRLAIAEAGNIGISQCRIASNPITVRVNAIPVQKDDLLQVCINKDASFTSTGTTAFQYAWTGPGGFTSAQQNPVISAAQPAQAGSYRIIVTSDKGCIDTAFTILQVNPVPIATVNPTDISICEGTTTQLQASGGATYKWTPEAGLSNDAIANPIAGPADTTLYTVVVSNTFGCTDTVQSTVSIIRKPAANAGPDKKMIEGKTVLLEGIASGDNTSWFWTPPLALTDANALQPQASPTQDITYTLHVISNDGCGSSTDDVFVRVYKSLHIPNAFSPNGDGVNDTWQIEALDTYPSSVTEIYNRNGQQVYRNTGYTRPWNGTYNGKPLPVGTYYYVIDLKEDNMPKLTGWIMILR